MFRHCWLTVIGVWLASTPGTSSAAGSPEVRLSGVASVLWQHAVDVRAQ
jgi:hypothetical protein